ncbi:DarT1-associated NADAR antitoxin family protein [Candidatus Spongiihabitans sp.]|uniref:DarT1-associated NADAR antitoxin family protein n=1 Tax=Candidatus Spongiihabitans sp. TaxID=3101308 RepID=UPI003C7D71F9
MAKRPVFIPIGKPCHLVEEVLVEFEWHHGFAPYQKKKNVAALHESADKEGLSPLLEVSTKSDKRLGQRLSAFSLKIKTDIGEISLEAAYQGSKVFEKGGPYTDIYRKDSKSAKQDPRIKKSGSLAGFDYFGQAWPLVPKTAFYDWLYLSALSAHQEFLKRLYAYKGFTDIEFNPQKSINCQAHTCALLVSLLKLNLLDEALKSQHDFIHMISSDSVTKNHSAELRQQALAI